MTPNEYTQNRLLAEALYWRMEYDNSNPEVGMGPTPEWLLREIYDSIDELEEPLTKTRRNSIIHIYNCLRKGRKFR